MDYSARILIRYCLARAAETSVDKSREWVAIAEAAGADEGIDLVLVRALSDEIDILNKAAPRDRTRERIEDRIKRLESFQEMAATVATELRAQLERAGPPKSES